ncbi:ribulose-phosphate 3-epimerase [Parabacteroides sp. OttesenSCG-928-G07]|nr:ribulose-phosphate 3-epimerase [Parabacteroides sp. OttesenSCG-928-G21]MDL2278435.1 ribulose-phosphate 3-epimerase [Parabacteroides sp. OttesenSCG-928-G07]
MSRKIKISPSMACADILNLERDVHCLEEAGIELLHIDIMDGVFVPNFCLNIDILRALNKLTNIPLECHLMINDPERYVEDIAEAGAEYLSIHYEATPHAQRALAFIRRKGMKAGIALNPATPVDVLNYIIDDLDLVTLMMINPGFAGQKLIPAMIRKIAETRGYLNSRGKENVEILVDGNVSIENIPLMVEAGATILVGGTSSVFREGHSIKESVELVKSLY